MDHGVCKELMWCCRLDRWVHWQLDSGQKIHSFHSVTCWYTINHLTYTENVAIHIQNKNVTTPTFDTTTLKETNNFRLLGDMPQMTKILSDFVTCSMLHL